MTWWQFIGREAARRPARAALTTSSVVIAVAAVAAVTIASDAISGAFDHMQAQLAGAPAIEIVATTGGRFDESLAGRLRQVAHIRGVIPLIYRPSVLRFRGQRVTVVLVGVGPGALRLDEQLELTAGGWLPDTADLGAAAGATDTPALLDSALANHLGLAVGDRVVVLSRRGAVRTDVLGTVTRRGPAAVASSREVLMPLEVVQDMFAVPGRVDMLRLPLSNHAAADRVIAEITPLLPTGLVARRAAGRMQMGDETLHTVRIGLNFAAVLTVTMAMFIILNTFLMNLSERRKQFATLRCVGATRGQIARLLLSEGLIMGLSGTAIGLVVGTQGARLLAAALGQLLQVAPPTVELSFGSLAIAGLLGPVVTLLAVYLPARVAGGIDALEALANAPAAGSDRFPRALSLMAFGSWTLSAVMLWGVASEHIGERFAPLAGVMMLVSFVLLIPLALRPMVTSCGWLLARLSVAESQLAEREVLRRRTRTSLTIAVVVIAIGNSVGLGTTILNYVNDVRGWYRHTMVGDLFLLNLRGQPLTDPAFEAQLRGVAGVTGTGTFGFANGRVAGTPVLLVVRSFPGRGELPLAVVDGPAQALRERLESGEVALGAVLAQRLEAQRGDELLVEAEGQRRTMRIAAVVSDYTFGGMSLYVDRNVAERQFGIEAVDMYIVQTDSGAKAAAAASLIDLAKQHGLAVQSFDDLSRFVDGLMQGVVVAFWGLLMIGFAVSFIGIANTLTMNVLEQTRDLGTLRIVGATYGQAVRMIVFQALLLGAIGLTMGLIAGLSTTVVINLCSRTLLGQSLTLVLHPALIGGTAAGMFAIVCLAAWMPARRMGRMDLIAALACQ